MRTTFFFFLLVFTFLSSVEILAQQNLTIYLFRHAETTGEGSNPHLSEQGKERAQNLLRTINADSVDILYSTQYHRTQETIQPASEYYQKKVESYNPRELQAFAEELKTLKGIILVSGHSNTTPALAHYLTGQEISPINESEYDNLFVISFVDGQYTMNVLNYAPFYDHP